MTKPGANPQKSPTNSTKPAGQSFWVATLASLGVVFGDIGTSPLYTVQVCFGEHGVHPDRANILGVLSLIFWALTLVVTVKYVLVLMNADNRGEGGIMALIALVPPEERAVIKGRIGWISLLVIAGAALLYGDGMITPAISVLSAVEGLGTVDAALTQAVVPLTVVILLALFAIQSRGTGALGKMFAPIMLVWFFCIGLMGVVSLLKTPEVLQALLPTHAVAFFARHGIRGLMILGSVVMAVTGGEALYADMGHFGRGPIRLSWLSVVFPALLLSYFGQAALILRDPSAVANPFYSQVHGQGLSIALVVLAAAATIIASQGLISAVFSLTHQAIRLGYFPRLEVRHTSSEVEGQIYLPAVNWCLAFACLALVLTFQASANLAAAYGLAVSGTMAITSVVFYSATRYSWKWPIWKSGLVLIGFLSFDIPFFLGGVSKFLEGGYIPFVVGLCMFSLMVIWCWGRSLLGQYYAARHLTEDKLFAEMDNPKVHRSFPLGIYPSMHDHPIPPVLIEQLERFHALPEQVVLLTVKTENVPYVCESERFEVEVVHPQVFRLRCCCGFMEVPDVPQLLRSAAPKMKLKCSPEKAIYVIGKETLATREGTLPFWQSLFVVLSRNASDVTLYYNLPTERTVEIGLRVSLEHESHDNAVCEVDSGEPEETVEPPSKESQRLMGSGPAYIKG